MARGLDIAMDVDARQVRVLPVEGRWCAWTDTGHVEWFTEQHEAMRRAMLWASANRPARAVLEIPGHEPRLLCSYPFGTGRDLR